MRLLITVLFASTVWGYRHFQDEIPNGGNVLNPCKNNDIWGGLGHRNPRGGGIFNPFGVDFKNAGMKWTKALCEMDSDGDGITNGEELGDPDCMWTKGNTPTVTLGIGHPGICTPRSAPACQAVNSWIDCEIKGPQCDALKEDGIKSITVRLPETVVPAVETNYYCMFAELPTDGDYHLVGFESQIDNTDINHHIILFGCESTEKTSFAINNPHPCGMKSIPECRTMLGVWNFGTPVKCMHEDSGFRIGKNGFKYAYLQFHWNNPQLRTDYTDSSGLKLYYTPNRRPHNARMWTVGSSYFEIPPGEEEFEVEAWCRNDCTSRYLSGPVYITRAENHMHYLGRKQKIQHYRNGVWIRDITNDMYDFNSFADYAFTTPIEVKPGDEIKSTCTFRSVGRNKTTRFGEDSSHEMCFGFLVIHPLENLKVQDCLSWRELDTCKIYDFSSDFPVIDGCHYKTLLNPFHPDLIALISNLRSLCRSFDVCTQECKHYVRGLLASNKCFSGVISDFLKYYTISQAPYFMEVWAALDSCKTELEMEDCQEQCDSAK
ncbi:tyramine beta-hydroxylase-like [Mizuhopecten yessoensis]|uniref:Temptin n=1 Tax=Mizuhopecten yessoensis TaxID=6573 RepID=A0A210QV82_MIZYE|nr:tyramine beta-hydroxylase-like [Mizuhopecten yessoensis]OWF52616.1 Temptin [Mizuhopecten yessoensis]